jgi:methylisocitrate lyase
MNNSPGKKFRQLVSQQAPLQILGTINAYCAMLAQHVGAQAIYLSGAGVANASLGLPDLGITNLNDVMVDAARITEAVDVPILVDIDTGFGHRLGIARTIRELERIQVAAVHIEDQVVEKRCGHRPGKTLVSVSEMQDRLKAALDARQDQNFVIIARTDAYANEGLEGTIERIQRYQEVGADYVFLEAGPDIETYARCHQACSIPLLANCTEFGKTPLLTREQWREAGVSMILYPLSAFRAMSQAALHVYQDIVRLGTQQAQVNSMQTREALYEILNYAQYESLMNQERF